MTENVRQEHEWERIALAELRRGSVSRAVAMYTRRYRININTTSDSAIDRAVENWYRDVQDIGDPAEVLLIGHRNTTVDELNRHARALVGKAGFLDGPALDVDDRTFQAGDRVVCLKNRARLGVLNGDLATITAIDTERRTVTLYLDRTDQLVTVPHWYLDDGHLDWGYAVTGHKSQGGTARRAYTVAGDAIDREWIYVTTSRGREANTIYLADPDMSRDECEHLAHTSTPTASRPSSPPSATQRQSVPPSTPDVAPTNAPRRRAGYARDRGDANESGPRLAIVQRSTLRVQFVACR